MEHQRLVHFTKWTNARFTDEAQLKVFYNVLKDALKEFRKMT